jgi:hypothetical protein
VIFHRSSPISAPFRVSSPGSNLSLKIKSSSKL